MPPHILLFENNAASLHVTYSLVKHYQFKITITNFVHFQDCVFLDYVCCCSNVQDTYLTLKKQNMWLVVLPSGDLRIDTSFEDLVLKSKIEM